MIIGPKCLYIPAAVMVQKLRAVKAMPLPQLPLALDFPNKHSSLQVDCPQLLRGPYFCPA